MPWTCCGVALHDDALKCPRCDLTKKAWTLRLKRTRVFTLSREFWVEIELRDLDGKPLAGQDYRVVLPNGMAKNGTLDEQGFAHVKSPNKGLCQVSFPGYDSAEMELRDLQREAVRTAWLEVRFQDEAGRPCAELPYRIQLPDGVKQEGKLDENGFLRLDGIAPGDCKLWLEGVDSTWVAPPAAPSATESQVDAWVELVLRDEEGRPQPDERYTLIAPDGEEREGNLDEQGFARVCGLAPGLCSVSFPDLSSAASSAPVPAHGDAGPAASDSTGWIELVLRDSEGRPRGDERYRLKLPDGQVKEGKLDASGVARVTEIPEGTCKVSFPELEAVTPASA